VRRRWQRGFEETALIGGSRSGTRLAIARHFAAEEVVGSTDYAFANRTLISDGGDWSRGLGNVTGIGATSRLWQCPLFADPQPKPVRTLPASLAYSALRPFQLLNLGPPFAERGRSSYASGNGLFAPKRHIAAACHPCTNAPCPLEQPIAYSFFHDINAYMPAIIAAG
jgi:hypothetical protein